MRLIDPDAAFDEIDERLLPEDATEYARGVLDAMQYIVNDAPEIDAEPVRHAYWIVKQEFHGIGCDEDEPYYCTCSHCHKNTGEETPYCPYCGARMDQPEVTEEENE